MRLDKYLQQHFSLKSRTYAENLIQTGAVLLNGEVAKKPSADVDDCDVIEILDTANYASQGAYKLEEAFCQFSLDVEGEDCADIGCSNGGFCDCLLRHGANSVLAVDVAECALPQNLLSNEKVTFLRANARDLSSSDYQVDFVCCDVSFISLKHVLGGIYSILKSSAQAVVLVKPQFELDKSALTKNGIVKSEKLRARAVEAVKGYAIENGFEILGIKNAPIRYENKNIEYLLWLKK